MANFLDRAARGVGRGLLVFVEHQRPHVTGAMHHADNYDLGGCEAVVQNVIAVEVRPQALSQIVPAWADLGSG